MILRFPALLLSRAAPAAARYHAGVQLCRSARRPAKNILINEPRGHRPLLLSSEKGEHRSFCLYERQGVRIVCEDRKDDSPT
jgi:hypothetical protein